MNRVLITLCAAIATWAVNQHAHAGDTSAAVQYRDLDLSNSSDVAELERRIDAAAREVCPLVAESRIGYNPTSCRTEARGRAEREMREVITNGNAERPELFTAQ